ncbi:MAG: bifunctional demethylmenaquinone methyltransferase/2-methoxy-6-polyprenyl-1,4-benzoquinol methylase UbiE [Gammaproteobacteria bacterium]|nr:bifunctional demethylmenaquinone methyltransferase/2-methoxy-6-polyprenyl-1,4-benzoquinol methylase UbiE [Gammaproteobacteria bacterium]
MSEQDKATHFGFEQVAWADKAAKVAGVFHSVANQYDIMNDVMSFGAHRLWKRFAVMLSAVRSGQRVLDVAGGTGDLSKLFSRRVGSQGLVVLSDINGSMLARGRDRLLDEGCANNVMCVQFDAENIPFPDNYFDCVSIAFGLRNVTDKARALQSMSRVLRPGGRLIVLEFSKPVLPLLDKFYDAYSFNVIPKLGKLITGDADSYQYLVESIRMHPDQESLKSLMLENGFDEVDYFNLTGGVVAVHRGFKY